MAKEKKTERAAGPRGANRAGTSGLERATEPRASEGSNEQAEQIAFVRLRRAMPALTDDERAARRYTALSARTSRKRN